MSKIFVQIASYRDSELIPTLKDCISKAKWPENLVFAICWQHDDTESLGEYAEDPRFKIIDVPYQKSEGACWARNLINQLYDGEEYTLQLDSHHRFVENWDEICINLIKQLQSDGHKKPLLTSYIPSYDPKNDPSGRVNVPWQMNFDRFFPEGPLFTSPSTINNWEKLTKPVHARFLSAHFIFTLGSFVKDVPYDPNLYFHGEEISLAVRAYTHGFDLFHPHFIIAWHHYTRAGYKKQWDDDKKWTERNNLSYLRIRKLFEMDDEVKDIDFGKYDFGKVRTLSQYEKYAGVNFKKRSIQKYTLDCNLAPNPVIEDETEYQNSFLRQFKYCIDLYKTALPEKDYDCLVIAFKDINGKEIYRADADENEVKKLFSSLGNDNWFKIWRTFYMEEMPYSYLIWPHSKSKGWMDRIENKIPSPTKRIPKSPEPISLWKDFEKQKDKKFTFRKDPNKRKIFLHIPAYREPELVPTIKSALQNAKHPERLVFGICRQFNPTDKFDNIDEFRNDPRFRIIDMDYKDAKGLPFARYQCNTMLLNEEYVLQLDSHHRFNKNWDSTLIEMHDELKEKGVKKPILAGYLPFFDPFNDPESRVQEPWQSIMSCFYPHGTIFIRPGAFKDLKNLKSPAPARFLSGHFCFADNHWAKTIKHDSDIFFSGEEINLTVRSFTHGYDIFHPHKVVIWHAMARKERDGILVWDDQARRGENWGAHQDRSRAKIRQLLGTEYNGYDLSGYDLGKERTLHDYEKFAGICFKEKSVQQYTMDNELPPNPPMSEDDWKNSLKKSFYYLVNVTKRDLPATDYKSILIAFDDNEGKAILHKYITGKQLQDFMSGKSNIHYEEYFLTDKWPSKVVYWGISETRGWAERVEKNI